MIAFFQNNRALAFYAQFFILAACFIYLFGGTIIDLVRDWGASDNYSHGYLIPFITLHMIWQKKSKLAKELRKPSNSSIVVLVLGLSGFFLAKIGAELFTMRICMLLTIAGIIIFLWGTRITAIILVPLAYLFFMFPPPTIIWNQISFPLQLFASWATEKTVHFSGIPLLREGNVLHLSTMPLEVVDACSGLRSLISLLALSAALAYTIDMKPIKKWVLFFSAIPIALLANIARLTITVLLAVKIAPETAEGFMHEFSGLFVFLIGFIILCMVCFGLSRFSKNEETTGRV